MSDDIKDRLHAIVAASVALRYLLEFDGDDWSSLPANIRNTINDAAMACDRLAPVIIEAVGE